MSKAMNPVAATNLYIATFRAVLKCDEDDPETFADLIRIHPIFRDSISCLVCGKLLQHPMTARNSTCEHSVCRACKGKKMSKNPHCSGCQDYEEFTENRRMGLLLESYMRVCEYMAHPPFRERIASAAAESPEIMSLLEDILAVKRKVKRSSAKLMPSPLFPLSPAVQSDIFSSSELTEQSSSLEQESFSDMDMPSLTLPLSPWELPSSPELTDPPSSSSVDTAKDEPQWYAVQVKAEPADPLEVSPSELTTTTGSATKQELTTNLNAQTFSIKSTNLTALTLSSFNYIKNEPMECSFDEAVENLKSASSTDDVLLRNSVMSKHCTKQEPSSAASSQSDKAVTENSRSATMPVTLRVNRKRSRSEGDHADVTPAPITSFLKEPPVAAPVSPPVPHEPKDTPHPVAKVPSEGFLRLQQAFLGTTANMDQSIQQSVKRVCAQMPQNDQTKQPPTLLITPRPPTKASKKTKDSRRGCKCGRATQNTSVLTCRGQRCPCYASRRACMDCDCRGCQNSYMENGKKKLEAFAVPEKALEQTRLTLGINYVTSIPVSITADSAVASFLVATSQDTLQ